MAALFQFVMRSGPTPGAVFSLEGDQLVIGRDSTSGIPINDAEVSRKHARLAFQGGKYVLEDLGSTNGTFVNGQRLSGPVVLKSGDVVSLGEQIVLMYESLSADAGSTMISAHKVVPPRPSPAAPMTVSTPAPQQFSSSSSIGAPIADAKKTNRTPIFIGAGVLILICLCAGVIWYVDSNFLWCTFLPFLSGCR